MLEWVRWSKISSTRIEMCMHLSSLHCHIDRNLNWFVSGHGLTQLPVQPNNNPYITLYSLSPTHTLLTFPVSHQTVSSARPTAEWPEGRSSSEHRLTAALASAAPACPGRTCSPLSPAKLNNKNILSDETQQETLTVISQGVDCVLKLW